MNQIIFEYINNLSRFGFIKNSALFLSYVFPYLFAGLLVLFSSLSSKKITNFILVFTTSSISWLASVFLKHVFKVARPVLENPIVLETGYSFPSSHATVSMAAAVALFYFNKTWGYVFFVFAILIGLSRVVLGVHYPIDVLTGWILGALVAMISINAFFRLF